jgi:hypothetical protein
VSSERSRAAGGSVCNGVDQQAREGAGHLNNVGSRDGRGEGVGDVGDQFPYAVGDELQIETEFPDDLRPARRPCGGNKVTTVKARSNGVQVVTIKASKGAHTFRVAYAVPGKSTVYKNVTVRIK